MEKIQLSYAFRVLYLGATAGRDWPWVRGTSKYIIRDPTTLAVLGSLIKSIDRDPPPS